VVHRRIERKKLQVGVRNAASTEGGRQMFGMPARDRFRPLRLRPQVLAQSVVGTNGFDDSKRADYMRSHTFATVVGDIAFGSDGEWAKSRTFFTQFQNVAPNDVE
jgi:hypothetical protein